MVDVTLRRQKGPSPNTRKGFVQYPVKLLGTQEPRGDTQERISLSPSICPITRWNGLMPRAAQGIQEERCDAWRTQDDLLFSN